MNLRKIEKKNKKGQLSSFSIFQWMIVSFLAVVLFAGLIYVMGTLKDVFDEVGIQDELSPRINHTFPCLDNPANTCGGTFRANLTLASQEIWGVAYDSILALRIVGAVYILAMGAGIVIVGFLERKHPFLFFVYILITLLAVIFAPTISNAYQGLLDEGIFAGELDNHPLSTFLLLNLPMATLVIGALGGIGLFINLVRAGGEGEIR